MVFDVPMLFPGDEPARTEAQRIVARLVSFGFSATIEFQPIPLLYRITTDATEKEFQQVTRER